MAKAVQARQTSEAADPELEYFRNMHEYSKMIKAGIFFEPIYKHMRDRISPAAMKLLLREHLLTRRLEPSSLRLVRDVSR